MYRVQQSKKTSTRESGVSEVIGAVLLISIGVTAAAVIGVAVLSQPTPVNIPALDAIISSVGHTIQIYHNGGDTLQSSAIQILVDGTVEPFQKGTDSSWQSWSIGETLTYVDPNPNGAKSVQIVYTGASSPAILASAYFGQNGMPLASRTITATAGTGGTISPYGTVGVIYGDSQQFTITPNTGYHIVDVAVDGSSVGAVPAYTFPSVTSDHSISAAFAINQYTITPSAIGNGAISPNTLQTVNYNATPSFTFTPNANYQLSFVTVDGSNVTPSGNSYTFPPVTANHTISARFAIQTYTINATAGSNGAISPSGMVNVNSGANQSFTITNTTGYSISNVLVDGVPNGSISGYTFTNVQANHTISATFAGLTYTITPSAGANGAISPGIIQTVNYSATPSFTFTPDANYQLSFVTVDGSNVTPSGNSYTFPPVTASHAINAQFTINTLTITAPASTPNGTISPSGVVNVNYGANQVYTITNNTGYYVATILVDGSPVGSPTGTATSYTFFNVTVNHTISATFLLNPVIMSSAGTGGTISPLGATSVVYGQNQAYSILPTTGNPGYTIANVVVDGVSQGIIATYTFTNVITAHTISATFNPVPAVTSISPTTGPSAGGTPVTITGTNLIGATAVKFGTATAPILTNTGTTLTTTSPAGSAGIVDITVTTPNGTSVTGSGDQYDYYTVQTFTSSGPSTVPSGATKVDYLVVAGGGGGGRYGGGGGAGAVLTGTLTGLSSSYTITVGGGGAGSSAINTRGTNGGNSVFGTITATGGGGGGSNYATYYTGANGGSGGGGVRSGNAGGTGTTGGNNGGAGNSNGGSYLGGGGGGAGATGTAAATTAGGGGGTGTASSISGSSITYSCGGGGGAASGGGRTAGGAGCTGAGAGGLQAAGSSATGYGSGGGGSGTTGTNGGAGYQGIVILKYY